MFDNPTDNHTDILVPLYYKLPLREAKNRVNVSPVLPLQMSTVRLIQETEILYAPNLTSVERVLIDSG